MSESLEIIYHDHLLAVIDQPSGLLIPVSLDVSPT